MYAFPFGASLCLVLVVILLYWLHDGFMLQVEVPKTKVIKKTVPVSEVVYGALASSDLQKVVEKEFEMALQDRVMEETKDKKNAVESYVYDMRNKVCRRSSSCHCESP